jgi:hypothetical protein
MAIPKDIPVIINASHAIGKQPRSIVRSLRRQRSKALTARASILIAWRGYKFCGLSKLSSNPYCGPHMAITHNPRVLKSLVVLSSMAA